MLKKISFIISVIGISFLLFLLTTSPKELQSPEDLNKTKLNERITISGIVESEKEINSDFKILSIKNIEIVCKCSNRYLDKNIQVTGIVEEYNNKKQINLLKIQEIP